MPVFGAIGGATTDQNRKRNPLNRYRLMNGRLNFFPFFHRNIHRTLEGGGKNYSPVCRNQLSILTPEDWSGMVG
jgi:hypothetical protein